MLSADFHLHTCYSPDTTSPPARIISRCQEVGINCLAVTDHNTIEGALELKRTAPFTVIVAEEILTSRGEIIGLFLTENIPPRLSPQETVDRIKAQKGLVCIPHPCDRFRKSRLHAEELERILPRVDIIEVFNSRTTLKRDSAQAAEIALAHKLPGTAGSDAHTLGEIGSTWVDLPEFNGPEEFLESLRQAHVFSRGGGHFTRPLLFFPRLWAQMTKRFNREQEHV